MVRVKSEDTKGRQNGGKTNIEVQDGSVEVVGEAKSVGPGWKVDGKRK